MPRERHKSSDIMLPSTSPNKDGQPFVFEKKTDRPPIFPGDSHDDEELPYYTKPVTVTAHGATGAAAPDTAPAAASDDSEFASLTATRPRAHTLDEKTKSKSIEEEPPIDPDLPPALPTVFKWDGGGRQVFISGTFSEWRSLPMVRSHGDFVTIIDLPEGDHQYKFCVDGEWRHDPKLVSDEIFMVETHSNSFVITKFVCKFFFRARFCVYLWAHLNQILSKVNRFAIFIGSSLVYTKHFRAQFSPMIHYLYTNLIICGLHTLFGGISPIL